jgi:hypothetical protein
LGGPIKKNKAFFFVLIDQQRYVEKQNVVSTVLTAPARQGIFRYLTKEQPAQRRSKPAERQCILDDAICRSQWNTLGASPANGAPLFTTRSTCSVM